MWLTGTVPPLTMTLLLVDGRGVPAVADIALKLATARVMIVANDVEAFIVNSNFSKRSVAKLMEIRRGVDYESGGARRPWACVDTDGGTSAWSVVLGVTGHVDGDVGVMTVGVAATTGWIESVQRSGSTTALACVPTD